MASRATIRRMRRTPTTTDQRTQLEDFLESSLASAYLPVSTHSYKREREREKERESERK